MHIENYLKSKGFDLGELLVDNKTYKVTNMAKAASIIKNAIANKYLIYVVADYDVDGVSAGSGMDLILRDLGANFVIRFPKRMSEGYGFSDKILNEINDEKTLIVTVDNGISSVETIEKAENHGWNVVVIDHHQMRGDGLIPAAECIVDPHIFKEEGEFEDYCGAGLVFKLAEELGVKKETIDKCKVFASIATIQDSVPLLQENRRIVREGIDLLNKRKVDLPGLYSLCRTMYISLSTDPKVNLNEDSIAFKIGPCINAIGRLEDDGAKKAYNTILHYEMEREEGIQNLVSMNEKRKALTATQQQALIYKAEKDVLTENTTCLVLYLNGLHEGVIGINASMLCDKYHMPCIVLTDSEEEGILKGSARSIDGINIKECLDKVSQYVYKYGGHAGAAGLSVKKTDFQNFVTAINAVIPKVNMQDPTKKGWDIELTEDEVLTTFMELRRYAPFGEGFPAPIFKVRFNALSRRNIGAAGVALSAETIEAVNFSMREKMNDVKGGMTLNLIGTLDFSSYSKKPQVIFNDFQIVAKKPANRTFLV